jgi:ATPase subunit of ABC transporter with duplicated ATPase domains
MVLSFLAPTLVAMRRIATFLTAEELASPYTINEHTPDAITVDGDFTWENIQDIERPEEEEHDPARKMLKAKEKKEKERAEKERKKRQAKEAKKRQKEGEEVLPSVVDGAQARHENPKEEPFAIKDLKLNVHRGAFVGIIGRVGSGKVCISNLPVF